MIVDVGESNSGSPATTTDAIQYKNSHNYQSPTIVVADPSWKNLQYAVTHGSGNSIALPHMIVLGGDMTLHYSGNDLNTVVQKMTELTGEQFTPAAGGGSCEGFCGGQGAGCYCDDECYQYGDCCTDVCDVCGFCN